MAPSTPREATALLALMLLHDSRRDARQDENGDVVVLEEQDRELWDKAQISEALPLVDEALQGEAGPFALQAAIASEHCKATRSEDTNWRKIVELYDALEFIQPSPIVSLNRAVAIAMRDGPREGLTLIDSLSASGELDEYHLLHAARADLLRRLDITTEAAKSYTRALELVTNESERRYLERRKRECKAALA
jgi:RNA polymerase sigma-70 factor (ECF subfamily)